jgi:hypothetical protein
MKMTSYARGGGPVMENPEYARLLIAISFHYTPARLRHLADVIKSLSEFPVAALTVVLYTNAHSEGDLRPLRQIFVGASLADFTIESVPNLENPWLLTWSHKELIPDLFLDRKARYTHFIYVEADIRLTFANFEYWLQGRNTLRAAGLLPSFLRFEWRESTFELTTSDMFWRVYSPGQPNVIFGTSVFVSMPNPYNPLFIFDTELATEYIASTASDPTESAKLCEWGLAERSAMGLCMTQVPSSFPTRYVVRFDGETGEPPAGALVRHLPDNYANNDRSALGKVPMAGLVVGARSLFNDGRFPIELTDDFRAILTSGGGIGQLRDHYVLVSDHDTILYYDGETGRLKHAPFGLAPLNLAFQRREERGRLLLGRSSADSVIPLTFAGQNGLVRPVNDDDEAWFESAYYTDGTVSIRRTETYLGADLDGYAYNNRTWCLQWERYRLIPIQTLACMQEMANSIWLSHSDRRLVTLTAQPLDYGRQRGSEASALAGTSTREWNERERSIVFGPARFSLTDRTLPVDCSGNHLTIRWRDKAYLYSRYAPLIQYTINEDVASLPKLAKSISSLTEAGGYSGDICIISTLSANQIMEHVPAQIRERVTISLEPHTGPGIYQPILDCTADTIFNCDIGKTILDLLVERIKPDNKPLGGSYGSYN